MPTVCRPSALSSALAVVAYLSSIGCDFVFDDTLAIVNNPDVQPHANLSALWRNDFWGKDLVAHDSHKSYRPITILSFRAHTLMSGLPPSPRDFHATNVVLHAATTACVAELTLDLWQESEVGGRVQASARRAALLAGTLFALHPVHVEAVTGVVGRAELLCALCCFASAAAYQSMARPDTRPMRMRGAAQLGYALLFAACFAAAVLSKETGITLLGIVGVRELLVHLPERHRRGSSLSGCMLRCCLILSCAAAYAGARLALMQAPGALFSFASASLSESDLIRRAENPLSFVNGRLLWLLSVGRVNWSDTWIEPNSAGPYVTLMLTSPDLDVIVVWQGVRPAARVARQAVHRVLV